MAPADERGRLHALPAAARERVERLALAPHPEGGWYRETWRTDRSFDRCCVGADPPGPRSLATSILYLLPANEYSRLHRLPSDESWNFHDGSPLTIHVLDAGGYRAVSLSAAEPQFVVPAGSWFGATVNEPDGWTLVGCTVSPGFEFADLELGRRDDLRRAFPAARAIVDRLTGGEDNDG